MKGLHMLAFLLLIVGGLNWLVLALFSWDIGQLFGGQDALISKIIYVLVGLAAILELIGHKKACKYCKGSTPVSPSSSI
ncbi:MAG: DUF378 domain-containing protein [bacterium]|nr:DUF378 domain-containing protein [bacterium]